MTLHLIDFIPADRTADPELDAAITSGAIYLWLKRTGYYRHLHIAPRTKRKPGELPFCHVCGALATYPQAQLCDKHFDEHRRAYIAAYRERRRKT